MSFKDVGYPKTQEGLKKLSKYGNIGVQRMVELENKPFYDALIGMWGFDEIGAKDKALKLYSLQQEYLRDPKC